jgi:hypothetical protein
VSEPPTSSQGIDLSRLAADIDGLIAVRRQVLYARGRLNKPQVTDQDTDIVRATLHWLVAVIQDQQLWQSLSALAHQLDQTAPSADRAPDGPETDPLRNAAADLLAQLASELEHGQLHQASKSGYFEQAIEAFRLELSDISATAQQLATGPVPSAADEDGRARWISLAKFVMDATLALLTNVCVAAVFTVTAVQDAARHVVLGATELAGQTFEHGGLILRSALALCALATQTVISFQVIRDVTVFDGPAGVPDPTGDPMEGSTQPEVTRAAANEPHLRNAHTAAEVDETSPTPMGRLAPADESEEPTPSEQEVTGVSGRRALRLRSEQEIARAAADRRTRHFRKPAERKDAFSDAEPAPEGDLSARARKAMPHTPVSTPLTATSGDEGSSVSPTD